MADGGIDGDTRRAGGSARSESSETLRGCDLRTIGSRFAEMLLTD